MDSKKSNPFSIFFCIGLFIQFIFLGLKIVNIVDWSWWWVCSPLLIMAGIIHFMIFMCGIYYIYSPGKSKNDQNRT